MALEMSFKECLPAGKMRKGSYGESKLSEFKVSFCSCVQNRHLLLPEVRYPQREDAFRAKALLDKGLLRASLQSPKFLLKKLHFVA